MSRLKSDRPFRPGRKLVIVVSAASVAFIAGCFLCPKRWPRTYGGARDDAGLSIQTVSDGGFVIAGFTASYGAGDSDVYLVRTDRDGDTLWTRTFGGPGADVGCSVQPTRDGGYIVAGYTSSYGYGSYDVYLVKTDARGDTQWTHAYGSTGDDKGSSVRQTADGGYIVGGWTFIAGPQVYDAWLIKTDSTGWPLWTRTYGGNNDDKCHAVEPTFDGGYILAGLTYSFGAGNYDVYLVKTDAAGDTQWTRTFGGTLSDQAFSVCQARDSSYVAAGITSSLGRGRDDAFVVRVSPAGDSLWARGYGNPGLDFALSVCQNPDDDFYVAGSSDSYGDGSLDAWLFKLDLQGDIYWAVSFGGRGLDQARSVQSLPDRGCIMAGVTSSEGAGERDVYLIRTDRDGDLK